MTLSSLTKALWLVLEGAIFAGCIADTSEDSQLPWASSRSWEGIAPIAPSVMDRYD